MGWSVDEVRRRREELEEQDASKKASAAAKAGTSAKTTGTAKTGGSTGVTAGAPLATGLSTAKSGTAAGSKKTTTTATQSLGAKVLAQMDGTQTEATTAKTGKKLQTTQQQSQPEWLQTASGTPAAVVRGANESQKAAQKRRSGSEGVLAQEAQAIKDHTVKADAEDKFSDFTRLNRWMDADPKHRTLVSLIRMGKSGVEDAAALGSSTGDNAVKAQKPYTDAELIAKGYSQQQIDEARQYIAEYDALPAAEKAVRRTADTAKGIGGTVAAAVPLAGESLGTALWNIKATADNQKALATEVKSDPREAQLYSKLTAVDMDYQPQYSTEELVAEGYTRSEIDSMRARIAGTEVNEGVDKDESVGYQLYDYGKQHSERAQAGMNPTAQVAMSIGTSAAENLAVAGISPALVLPVLSAQGGAEAMGQSIEKGDSAGKTLVGGLAKFGAGWAINSVGAADLAKTMGEDYAKDTLAGKLADVVRSVADNGTLAQRYPTVANAVSGGIDNAMQAFVETYADKAIDAALGDAQAAEEMFSADTFLTALESGLSGGASGALGGAVGTQLGKMRMALETAEPSQSPAGDSSPERASLGTERQAAANDRQQEKTTPHQSAAPTASSQGEALTEQTAAQAMQSDDPAVRQLAQSEDVFVRQLAQDLAAGTVQEETARFFASGVLSANARAEVEQAYGIRLPQNREEIRQVLQEMADRQTAQQAEETALQPQTAAQEESEPQGTSTELKNGVLTTWNADGTVETQVVDPEMTARAQAETLAAKQTVENTGETVESETAQQEAPGTMRETVGLQQRGTTEKQNSVQRELQRWKVSEGAAKTISRNMPAETADESRYAAAASSLYRLGQMEDVKTFDKAMELAQGTKNLAVNTDYVLAQPGGEAALKIAWLQGKGELEAGTVQTGTPGGTLSDKSLTGSGRVLYKGTMRTASEVATQLIELNARATDTDAVLKAVLEGDERVKAYVDTAAGQIFFADSAGDVFGTVLHEDWHWYNALDAEGAKAVQQHVLEYLAKNEGFENIDELIRGKLSDYAQQGLTYEEAAEELVADAWRGIFDSEESFKSWVEFQRGQAEKNAGRAGTIRKVMNAVKNLLTDIVSRAKEVLAKDPENKAALRAQRLAEAEKRALQEEYFAHAEKAMENLRAAKENASALENKGAAKEKRMQIEPSEEKTEELVRTMCRAYEEGYNAFGIRTVEDAAGRLDVGDSVPDSYAWDFDQDVSTRETTGETLDGASAVEISSQRLALDGDDDEDVAREIRKALRNADTYYGEQVLLIGGKEGSEVGGDAHEIVIPNADVLAVIQRNGEEVEPVKKNIRMQIAETDEMERMRTEQQELGEQRKALKEERTAWLESAEVKAVETKKKALGNFSTEAKAYRESEEYQSYIAKRKDYNSRLAQLEQRSEELTDRMREAEERLQQRADAKAKDRQLAYNDRAEKYGGKAEYRRMLAKEQFGVTEDFKKAGYILPGGEMLNFAQSERTRDTDHRAIEGVFGPAEVKTGTEALNEFLLDGNVRVMAEGPGVDISADVEPTAQQLEKIREMVNELSSERGQFILDISTADGRVAASKEYSGSVDADKVVREIREYYKTGELAQESELAKFRYQLAEQASRDAKKNEQQQASRVIAEKAAALDTLSQFFGLTKGVTVSRSAVEELAGRWLKANGSKADRAKLAQETEVLVNYLKADGADMEKAEALAETLAGEIQDGAMYRNSELWDEYPELHKLEYTVNKTGKAKAELVKRYGSWSEAVAEARRHGVTLRQAEGVRDGNPAEQYESLVNDNRAVDGTPDGARALWKDAAEKAGVAGSQSFESTEWLDVLMNLHDAIKPKTMSRFADEAEYEDARVELAGRIIGDIMNLPQLTDAQAIFEGIQRSNLAAAKAAAGDEARAAEVEKGMKGVQKAQRKEFARRLAENQRTARGSREVQQMTELQRRNARAERQLNENLELMGVDSANVGDLNEKLTVLRESYEREWKAERKRMKTELQQMRDEARLEVRKLQGENADLAQQVRSEQRRADRAEYSLIVQENEIMEWEAENQRKAEAWQQKQAQRNAMAVEVARQQRDEEIAIAKRVAEKRVQKARDARKMDELKRGIRKDAAALNQMVLRPSQGKYVSQRLIVQAAEVAKLADLTVLNDRAVNRLTALQHSILKGMGSEGNPTAMTEEWKQTGVPELITELWDDLTAAKNAKLADLQAKLAEAEALPYSEKALALQERLQKRIRETESRTYLPMTVDQMRMLKAITNATLHVIRNENKTVSLAKAEEVSKIAEEAAGEVKQSRGNHPGGALDGVHNLLTKYNLDMLGAERVLRMLGGYKNGGQMEKIGRMLNDGQYRQTKITIEGEKLFADVTGKEHAKEARAFAGPGADLVDLGLTDTEGKAVPLTHAQMCSLYMHLRNKDSLEHLMTGGMVVPDAQEYSKGKIEKAYQQGQTVQLGMLTDADGTPTAESIVGMIENAMTDYDRAWCADMKEFFDNYTTKLINETSLQLVGYKRATVKNYFPIEVERSALATQIDGVKLDATIEGRGFLKNRVKSSQPILLEECSSVVQRSLRDTAAYAGLAAPIRDVQKILNAGVETRDGVKTLKNGIIKEQWGTKAVSYLDDLLTDLQTTQRKRSNGVSRMLGALRGNYAGAVLTLNPGVAIAQAASLPTAAAVLGSDTMAAVMPFVRNFSPKQKAALEAEIARHGDVLLQWRQRGSGEGELQSIGKRETLAQKGMDKLPGWLTGWINGMDEITVAALWEGSKAYVKNHAAEFEGAEVADSPAYWEAVNRMYQKTIEQTQPNYTVMQKAGIQRNPDEMVKTFTMFTTQRFQNAGILIDAVGDWKAQSARYKADATEENRAELKRATQQRDRAILSQTAQVAVFALMKICADFLLHRWDREQDENGDVTLESLAKRFASLSAGSAMGNFLFGSELYNLIDNALSGKDYDVISATNISAVNDLTSELLKFTEEMKKDTSEMDEAELEKHHAKLLQKGLAFVEDGFEVAGVPYGNGRKIVEAIKGYVEDIVNVAHGGKFSFNSLPESATGQYDRLYNAYASGDADEAQAAVEKLVAMGKEDEIYKQLKTRLKKYDPDIEAAAKAQANGNDAQRYQLEKETIEGLYEVLGIRKSVKEDAAKREAVIDCVTGAVNARETELLEGDSGDMYADLKEAADNWNAQDVQAEYDRLVRAGKSGNTVKSKITEAVKPEYLAGSDADKQRMADMLLALTDADGKALYTEKTFTQWEKAAEKAAQEQPEEDPYAALR